MPHAIKVAFDDPEKTAIRWDFHGHWSWEDWFAATRRSLHLRASMIQLPAMPIILNLQHSAPVPAGALPYARTTIELMDPRDYVVVANSSGYIRSLAHAFCALNPSYCDKVLLADDLDHARQRIAARDA